MKMFKITHGEEVYFADKYQEAKKIFNKLSRKKDEEYTRLYWKYNGNYSLSEFTGAKIRRALKPERNIGGSWGVCKHD